MHLGRLGVVLSLTHWVSSPPGVVLTIIDALGEIGVVLTIIDALGGLGVVLTIIDTLGELSTRVGTCYH